MSKSAREVADTDYNWPDISTMDHIKAATLQTIHRDLVRIERLMNQLGADGLHELIRRETNRARRIDKARTARITAKRKNTRAANLAKAQG